jgi:hypothetical protein
LPHCYCEGYDSQTCTLVHCESPWYETGSSGRQKTCSHQKDIVWTLFDPLSTTFIHFWVILISWRVKNLKSSLWFEKDRGPKIKFKWPSIQSFTAL